MQSAVEASLLRVEQFLDEQLDTRLLDEHLPTFVVQEGRSDLECRRSGHWS